MPQNIVTEDHIEQEALKTLDDEGYSVIYAPTIAPAPEGNGEQEKYSDVVLTNRLRKALVRINPSNP